MKRVIVSSIISFILVGNAVAQTEPADSLSQNRTVAMAPFWDNWFAQAALDVSLQTPYGYNALETFEKGKSFGVVASLGKWFTPEIALRARANWENGIPLLGKNNAEWLAPFRKPGVNMEKGGYLSVVGDVLLDVHNLFCGYDADRKWNMQVFPRAGLVYSFGVSKGSPLIGFGVGNTYRLNDKYRLFLDLGYQLVSSGFVGVDKNTGIGDNANGYMDIDFGVQYNFGNSGFRKARKVTDGERFGKSANDDVVLCNSFLDNWYLQFGLDMTLQNPYKHDFAKTFPKGKTFGLNAAVGKHFSPEVGVRFRLNWENGFPLLENHHLEWVGTSSDGKTNMEHGGYIAAYMDVPVSLTTVICGYDADRKLDVIAFPRAGLGSNLATESCSPMVGLGGGCVYRLNDRWSLYGDMGYQIITSEFFSGVKGAGTGMSVPTGCNGFLDCHVGVQYDL